MFKVRDVKCNEAEKNRVQILVGHGVFHLTSLSNIFFFLNFIKEIPTSIGAFHSQYFCQVVPFITR